MIFHVRVKASQRTDALWHDQSGLVAYIRGVPKDGEANDYLEKYIAKRLSVPKSTIRVVNGLQSKYKVIEVLADEKTVAAAIGALEEFPQTTLF